jgi:hypothetical protein
MVGCHGLAPLVLRARSYKESTQLEMLRGEALVYIYPPATDPRPKLCSCHFSGFRGLYFQS